MSSRGLYQESNQEGRLLEEEHVVVGVEQEALSPARARRWSWDGLGLAASGMLMMATMMVAMSHPGGRKNRSMSRSISPNGIVDAVVLEEQPVASASGNMSWMCHRYADDQTDDWCKNAGVFDGMEYKFYGMHHSKCGDCWCCKRPAAVADDGNGAKKEEAQKEKASKGKKAATKASKDKKAATTSVPAASHSKKTSREAAPRQCLDIPGVILAMDDSKTTSLWPACNAKWSEDCRAAGCCADWDMKCYEKDKAWSACSTECKKKDEKNQTWTCKALGPAKPRTFDTCRKACQDSTDCNMATFSSDGGGECKLTAAVSTKIVWASDVVSSTFCGSTEKHLKQLEAKVNEQVPWEMPREEIQNCSWSDEDCTATRCCNDVSCSKDFSQCYGFSCYQKTEYYAGCRLEGMLPTDGTWDSTWVGGPRELKTLGPAGSKVKLMGTSLYCFIVATWDAPPAKPFWSPESDLVLNLKNNGLSIYQCDAYDIFDGVLTPVAEWGSFSNIDAYQTIWEEVRNRGDYANMDWTVKVDSDAVFLPDRLKQHLDNLRVPHGAKVYIENNDYRFRFMGALEVVSRPAVQLFMEQSHTCIRGEHEGGEDFFMRGCMDALGISHLIDHSLLSDQYAGQDAHCTDGWAVAFHYYKSVIRWNWCYNEVVCGGRGKCDQGLDVEFVMED